MSVPVMTDANAIVSGSVPARRRALMLAQAVWLCCAALALVVVLLALPGYLSWFTASDLRPVDAPPVFVFMMRLITALASVGVVVLCLALAALLFWRKRTDTIALVTSFFLVAYGIAWGGALESALGAWQSEQARIFASSIGSILTFIPTLLLLFLFPSGQFVPRWTRWVLLTSLLCVPFFVLMPLGAVGASPFASAFDFAFLMFVMVGLYAQVHRYRTASNTLERLQSKAFVYGLFLAIGLGFFSGLAYPTILNTPPGVALPWWTSIAQLGWIGAVAVIPLALALAVMRYRLWDIDLIINRTLVYGLLTVGIVALYILVVGALSTLLQTSGNLLVSLLATGLIALLFQPLREHLQRGANRLTFGERDDPYRVLTRLGMQLESAMEPSAALTQTVETVATALHLPYVAIGLKHKGNIHTVAAYGTAPQATNNFPLIHAGETIGELMVAPRTPNETLTPADERLLRDLARHISIAARTAALTSDLEQARLRLVTERGEARRQLASDLHDGVGHQLVALTRQIERVVPKSPDVAALIPTEFLAEIKERLAALTTQVRGLAHQLYPPELEVLGLSGALRERVHGYATFRSVIDAPENMPRLPAEIEAAVYYIALETLTNIDKHANATTCKIRLRLSPADLTTQLQTLELDITDDGRGFTAGEGYGLGLLSMRARAAEVGGTCHIVSNPGSGTTVSVKIPCKLTAE